MRLPHLAAAVAVGLSLGAVTPARAEAPPVDAQIRAKLAAPCPGNGVCQAMRATRLVEAAQGCIAFQGVALQTVTWLRMGFDRRYVLDHTPYGYYLAQAVTPDKVVWMVDFAAGRPRSEQPMLIANKMYALCLAQYGIRYDF